MSFRTDIEQDLQDLLSDDMFGVEMVIDSDVVTGVWHNAMDSQVGITPGAFTASIVERFRLIAKKEDIEVVVGQELEINGVRWIVVGQRPAETLTDIVCERYTA
jgi:hypothetical protein